MLKALVKDSEEAKNFKTFCGLRSSRNHIVHAEVVECDHSDLVIMPFLSSFRLGWKKAAPAKFFDFLSQVIEVSD